MNNLESMTSISHKCMALEWTKNAINWLQKADKYGNDMLSSRISCLNDAEHCIRMAKEFYSKAIECQKEESQ